MPAKDKYHHGALREALISEGLALLEESGVASISLRSLSTRIGVSANAPYRHFKDKDELLAVLAAQGFVIFSRMLEEPPEDKDPLEFCAAQYVAFAVRHPALYRLMFSPLGYSLKSESCRIHAEKSFGILISTSISALQRGKKPHSKPEGFIFSFWAFLHGWSLMMIDQLVPPEQPAANFQDALQAFLDG